jgi:hypothetical protein
MTEQDLDRFRRALERLWFEKGRSTKPTAVFVHGYFHALLRFPIESVMRAAEECRNTLARFPSHPEWIAAAEAVPTPEDNARVAKVVAEARALLEDAPTVSQIGTVAYQQAMVNIKKLLKGRTERKAMPYARKQYSAPGVEFDPVINCVIRSIVPEAPPQFAPNGDLLLQPPTTGQTPGPENERVNVEAPLPRRRSRRRVSQSDAAALRKLGGDVVAFRRKRTRASSSNGSAAVATRAEES